MFNTDAEEISYILSMLKDNLKRFPNSIDENSDRYYTIGVYLTKHQTEMILNILKKS